MSKLKPGIYWVKLKGEKKWTIGEYHFEEYSKGWYLIGSEEIFGFHIIELIGNEIINPYP